MVQDLSLPVEIAGAPIARTPDGLVMSSRNAYLTDAERRAAPRLYAELSSTAQALAAGGDFELLKEAARARLAAAGFRPDYLEWRSEERRVGVACRLVSAASAEDRRLEHEEDRNG